MAKGEGRGKPAIKSTLNIFKAHENTILLKKKKTK